MERPIHSGSVWRTTNPGHGANRSSMPCWGLCILVYWRCSSVGLFEANGAESLWKASTPHLTKTRDSIMLRISARKCFLPFMAVSRRTNLRFIIATTGSIPYNRGRSDGLFLMRSPEYDLFFRHGSESRRVRLTLFATVQKFLRQGWAKTGHFERKNRVSWPLCQIWTASAQ